MNIEFLILGGLASLGLAFLNLRNKKKARLLKEKMQRKIQIQKKIEAIENSEYKNEKITEYIVKLLLDFDLHENIGKTITDSEILQIEEKLKFGLPKSYKIFLKYFGDGGFWIYHQSIDQIQNYSWLNDYRVKIGKTIKFESKKLSVSSLLSLMTEDSNGGAWCWLTSEKKENNEYSLVYFINGKLHYKVENFTEWLSILVNNNGEVIRSLDLKENLGLG